MSYTKSNGRARTFNGRGTTLIARRGYSDLGARRGYNAVGAVECGAGQTFRSDVTFAGTKGQCMTDAQYNECKSTGKLYGQTCTVSSADGGVLSAIGGALKGLLGLYGSAKAAEGQNAAYQQMLAQQQQQAAGPPSWLVPVAIAGAGVVAVVLLTRKK